MAPRSRLAFVDPWKVFPKEERLAPFAVNATILLADMDMERIGITGVIPELDKPGGESWRLVYFLRLNLRTLRSTHDLINDLTASPEFEAWLAKFPAGLTDYWKEWREKFIVAKANIKRVRDLLGGKVGRQVGEVVVKSLTPGMRAEHGWSREHGMEPRLATWLCWFTIFEDVPDELSDEAKLAETLKRLEQFANATGAGINALTGFLRMYMWHHRDLTLDIDTMPWG